MLVSWPSPLQPLAPSFLVDQGDQRRACGGSVGEGEHQSGACGTRARRRKRKRRRRRGDWRRRWPIYERLGRKKRRRRGGETGGGVASMSSARWRAGASCCERAIEAAVTTPWICNFYTQMQHRSYPIFSDVGLTNYRATTEPYQVYTG